MNPRQRRGLILVVISAIVAIATFFVPLRFSASAAPTAWGYWVAIGM